MKNNNVINIPDSHQIEIQGNGTLAIIGKTQWAVTLMASNMMLIGDVDVNLVVGTNCIVTRLTGQTGDTIIFDCDLSGEIRNPQKFLKSIRNRLMREIHRAESEWHKDYNETYTMPDREEHFMFR